MVSSSPRPLIACALKAEVQGLKKHFDHPCDWAVTGMGVRRTRAALESVLTRHPPKLLIFTGTAGQLDPALPVGQVVHPEEWLLESGVAVAADEPLLSSLQGSRFEAVGRGLTVKSPIFRPKTRLRLHRRFGASICDMESAAALQVAKELDVPALALKVVSDTADSGLTGFYKAFPEVIEKLALYLSELLQRLDPP